MQVLSPTYTLKGEKKEKKESSVMSNAKQLVIA
jgi:hypothetical protein